jgi:hypothetical protein
MPRFIRSLRAAPPARRIARRPLAHTSAPACLALLALLLAGCGATVADGPGGSPTGTPGYPASASSVDRAVPPVILRNPAPGTLDVSMYVTFDQGVGDTQLMAEVSLGFDSGGQSVQFAGNERLTCDGTTLPPHNRVAVFQVVRAPAAQLVGTTIRCDYQAGQSLAGMLLRIPQPPAITSPRHGASIPRAGATIVSYRYDPTTTGSLLGIVALAPGSVSPKALARMNTPALSQATIDTSHFSPGAGSVVLTAILIPRITDTGAPFKSLSAHGSATDSVNVTWM